MYPAWTPAQAQFLVLADPQVILTIRPTMSAKTLVLKTLNHRELSHWTTATDCTPPNLSNLT